MNPAIRLPDKLSPRCLVRHAPPRNRPLVCAHASAVKGGRSSLITHPSSSSPAFTLIEVLVAMAITMVLLGIVVTIFGMVGTSVSASRAGIEMGDQLRAAKHRLQLDLQGVTAQMLPPRRPEYGEGYFEIIEGPVGRLPANTVAVPDENGTLGPDTTVGDTDDIVMLTTRSKDLPFIGRLHDPVAVADYSIQSQVAEVAWFLRGTTLYRRQLLVRPDLNNFNGNNLVWQPTNAAGPVYYALPTNPPTPSSFYARCDLSVRATGRIPGSLSFDLSPSPPGFVIAPNSLSDLTNRENRFAHRPFVVTYGGTPPAPPTPNNPPYGWPHDVRGWGIYYSMTPFGNSALRGTPIMGRLGLPTLRECSSPYWFLPGTADLTGAHQIALGDVNGNGMSPPPANPPTTSPNPPYESFDAWTNPNPAFFGQDATTATISSNPAIDSLTGTLSYYFPDSTNSTVFKNPPGVDYRLGEDVILSNVLSFDVRVWDPTAWIIALTDSSNNTTIYAPDDAGYTQAALHFIQDTSNSLFTYATVAQGAYVNLNYAASITDYFPANGISLSAAQSARMSLILPSTYSGPGSLNSGLGAYLKGAGGAYLKYGNGAYITAYTPALYDTGSWSYEHDGIDQDNLYGPDQGTNGVDDNLDGIVDDPSELEAPPPYTAPLRGIQIKIRCFEPDSQQIREVTIVQEFVPS